MSLRIASSRSPLRRLLSTTTPLLARSSDSSSFQQPKTYPSQALPKLTLNLNGSSSSSRADPSADGMGAKSYVGPFPMGVGMDSIARKGAPRKWKDLSTGGKAYRVGQNSTSLLVVATGGLLFFIIAASVTTELFSPNSSTVIFGKAVDLLKDNEDLKLYLIPPFTFHPPQHLSSHPRQPSNTRMSLHSLPSQITTDRSGVETHTFAFLIEGQNPGDYRSPTGWWGSFKSSVVGRSKEAYNWTRSELEKAGVVDPAVPEEAEGGKTVEESVQRGASWLGGWVGFRTRESREKKVKGRNLPELGTFTTGECQVRCEKNPTTHRLELKSINVSVPGRTSTSTFARQHRFTVPIPSDEDASWLDEVSRWWEGTAGEGEEKKEAESS